MTSTSHGHIRENHPVLERCGWPIVLLFTETEWLLSCLRRRRRAMWMDFERVYLHHLHKQLRNVELWAIYFALYCLREQLSGHSVLVKCGTVCNLRRSTPSSRANQRPLHLGEVLNRVPSTSLYTVFASNQRPLRLGEVQNCVPSTSLYTIFTSNSAATPSW